MIIKLQKNLKIMFFYIVIFLLNVFIFVSTVEAVTINDALFNENDKTFSFYASQNGAKIQSMDVACKHESGIEKYVGITYFDATQIQENVSWSVKGWEVGTWNCWTYVDIDGGGNNRGDFSIHKSTFPTCESVNDYKDDGYKEAYCKNNPDNGDTCEWYNNECRSKKYDLSVVFDGNGGSFSQKKDNSSTYNWRCRRNSNSSKGCDFSKDDLTPTRSGYKFDGWSLKKDCSSKDAIDQVTINGTFYACWIRDQQNNLGNGNSGVENYSTWCTGANQKEINGGCYVMDADNCQHFGICDSEPKCNGKCKKEVGLANSYVVNFYASGGEMRCNSPFANIDSVNCTGSVSPGTYNFPSSYSSISDGNNKLLGWTKLTWEGQPNCNSDIIEKGDTFEVNSNTNYMACFQEIIGGFRYVKNGYVADGGSVEYRCGEQLFVNECVKMGKTNYCYYIDETGANRKIYRDKLANTYEGAIAGCDETSVKGIEINGWRYPIISSDKYVCGEALYITNCTEDTCNFTQVSKYNVGEIDVNGTISRSKLVESSEVSKVECDKILIDDSDKKCKYQKSEGNKNKSQYTICYEKNTSSSKIKELVKKYYICDEKNGYYFDNSSLVSLGKENCNKNKICTDVYNVNCKKKDANPTLSVKSAIVGSNGKGIISVTGYARVGKITQYYYSENFISPTNNTKGWINTNSNTFTIESTPGVIYIWVKDSNGNISNAVSGVVIDTVNSNTTVKELKLYDDKGNIQAPTTGISYNDVMKSNNYVRLSNELIKDSKVLADGFNPFDMEYKLEVDSPTITVYATLTSTDSKYVEGYEPRTVNLNYGVNTVLIKIMNNEGKIRTYTILVTRKDIRTSDNTLKDISLSVGNINFNSNVTDYKIEIPKSTKSVEVKSTITSDKASYVEGYEPGDVVIDSDSTVKLIKIKSQTGTTRTYVLTFVKEGTDIISKESLQLTDLVIPGAYVAFESSISNYSFSVDYQTDVIDLYIPTKDSKAYTEVSIKRKNDSTFSLVSKEGIGLDVGENFIEIKVIDSDGNYSYYKLTIIRKEFGLEISKDTSLKDLKVLGYNIKFEPNKKDYTVKIKQEKSLVITAVPASNRAEVFIRGNEELTGFSTVRIKVIAENGEYETYSIDIKKDAFNKTIEITAIIVGFVIILGSSCIIVIKNKNKNKNDYYNE